MPSGDSDPATDRSRLPPDELTTRLDALDPGDELLLNDRDTLFEVEATDRYSLTVVDPNGNEYTISQNLQTGGWTVNEEVRWVGSSVSSGGNESSEANRSSEADGG